MTESAPLEPWVKAPPERSAGVVVPDRYNDGVEVYRLANKTVFWAEYNVIWCPQYRRRVLVGAVEDWLVSTVGGTWLEAVRRGVENHKQAG